MAMDFFEHQDRARRQTGRLVLLFVAAVVGIIALTYPVIAMVFIGVSQKSGGQAGIWQPDLFIGVTAGVLAVVTMGSLFKLGQLRGGGRVVAESLGGRLVDAGTSDPDERQLLNVVEEMAIASGVPVPPVYMMHDEKGINAFAAGFKPEDAVIGVTRGCVQLLDRDELQGVIAHEFSHILNGDMRLNIRLIGMLHGILVIALIGQIVFRSMLYSGSGRRSRSSNSKEGGGKIAILTAAAALIAIGYVGFFFGGLIKAAVSRQREFLADASAVQFTRYPKGIGGALAKIGGYSYGSTVNSPRASEVSHMFFGQGVKSWLGAATATHPPLPERIRRVDPDWDGQFPKASRVEISPEQARSNIARKYRARPPHETTQAISAMHYAPAPDAGIVPTIVDQIGNPTEAHMARAHELRALIHGKVNDATTSSFGACAILYALLLSEDKAVHQRQLDIIQSEAQQQSDALSVSAGAQLSDYADRLYVSLQGMDAAARLPLVDLAMPALHNLTHEQYETFKRTIRSLVAADQRIELFEWTLSYILMRRLAPVYEPGRRVDPRVRYDSLKPMCQHLAVLLSTLARFGHSDDQTIQTAFADGAARLQLDRAPQLLAEADCGLKQLSQALQTLNEVSIREKKKVIQACAACIVSDHHVTAAEGEILRAVCDALGCPMPPILPGQPVI